MKIHQLLKKINLFTLIEIVDTRRRRIFYGAVHEISRDEWNILTNLNVIEINPFLAEIREGQFKSAIQIYVSPLD